MKTNKQHIYTIVKWLILVLAYAYLAYKLIVFDGYEALWSHFATAGIVHYICLSVVFLLLPCNVLLEAQKWRVLIRGLQPLSLIMAVKAVLVGQTGAFFTPNHIGDVPTRVLLLRPENRVPAIALGCVGSMALTMVITVIGTIAAVCYAVWMRPAFVRDVSLIALLFFGVLLIVVVVLFVMLLLYHQWLAKCLSRGRWHWLQVLGSGLAYLSWRDLWRVVALSTGRFAVFSIQLYAMLLFMGVSLAPIEALVAIPTIYLLVTYTPSFAASEAAVRGSYAILILSVFATNEAGMALAGILLWCINYCVPMLIGSWMLRRSDVTTTNTEPQT
ncbi:MAG: lysylphosphatidylglycerol synthase domain-containing protein [Paludibacteraceae bacterium]